MTRTASCRNTKLDWIEKDVLPGVRQFLITDLVLDLIGVSARGVKRFLTARLDRGSAGLVGMMAAIALLIVDSHLFVAISFGLGAMVLIYRWRGQLGQVSWRDLSQWLSSVNSPLAITLASGGLVTLSTYVALSIWQALGSPLLALTIVLQGIGILVILGLLVWQVLSQPGMATDSRFDCWVTDLVAADPLRRLIAVRQINQFVQSSQLDLQQQRMAEEYLQLLLQRESEPFVHDAALEGLRLLDRTEAAQPSPVQPRLPKRMVFKHRRSVLKPSTVDALSDP